MTNPKDLLLPAQSGGMSEHWVRVANLKRHQAVKEWNDAELGRQCGRQAQQVYAWFSGKRNISEKLARSLEEQLKLPRGALDEGSEPVKPYTPRSGGFEGMAHTVGNDLNATKHVREMPTIRWADLSAMLETENAGLRRKAPHLETFSSASSKAKFVEMPDDSMSPEIAPGDHILFDPTELPRAGDIVLVRLPSGEYFVRSFRPRTAFVFQAEAINSNYQALSSADDGAQIAAVMIEHRRYRR
jgi:SOS-response transcriptional repressor LexA